MLLVSILGSKHNEMESMDNATATSGPARQAIPPYLFAHAAAGAGLILMGYFTAYLVSFEAILGNWTGPAVFMVVVTVMVMVLWTARKEEGHLKMGRALGLSLLAGVLCRMGYTLFNVLLFHVLRPDLMEAYVKLVLDKSNEALSSLGADLPDGFQSMLEESTRFSISIPGQLFDVATSCVWLFVVALVVAAVMKRTPDVQAGFNG